MRNSTRPRSGAKAETTTATTTKRSRKPSSKERFPQWLHPTGQWAKRIQGRIFDFGTGQARALAECTRVREFRERGLEPPPRERDYLILARLLAANCGLDIAAKFVSGKDKPQDGTTP